jgi:thioesterase domain-containing protein/acyl carrier protein
MDEFPALPNGKLDRKALPMPTNSVSAKEKPYLSPQTAFEKEIAAIWSKILKVEKIGMHDNFFELGGHSLLAAKMVVMVEKAVHRTITLQAIYEYSKLGEFLDFLNYDYQVNNKTQTPISEKLDDFGQLLSDLQNSGYTFSIRNARLFYESPNQIKNLEIERKIAKYYHQLFRIYWPAAGLNLAPIQPEGMADPFFIVHGEQSTPLLRDIFGKEQPLFDYFHQSCDGSRMKHKTVEEVAEMYLQQLLSIKSEGNFLLAGYSFGGLVAYEMAQRLINMGKKVNLLILIDTPTPGFKDYTYRFDSLKNKLKYYLINPVRDKITSVIWTIQCNYFLMLNKPIPLHLRTFYIVGNYERNEVQYKPQQYTGKLHLITAEDNFQPRDPYLGWWNFIKGGIELVPLPGDHREMVQNPETVKMMAFKIKEFIEEVKS